MALGRSRVCERVSVCECALVFRMCTRLPAHLCSHREPRWGRRSLAGAAAAGRGPRRPRRPRARASGLPARQEGLRSWGLVGGPATAACPGPPPAPSSWCCASPPSEPRRPSRHRPRRCASGSCSRSDTESWLWRSKNELLSGLSVVFPVVGLGGGFREEGPFSSHHGQARWSRACHR